MYKKGTLHSSPMLDNKKSAALVQLFRKPVKTGTG